MNLAQIRVLVADVFGRGTRIEVTGGWAKIACPLSTWTHQKGRDSNPSAGISIHDNAVSVFRCFTCGNAGPVQHLLRRYSEFTGENLDALIEELEEEAYLGPRSLPEWGEVRNRGVPSALLTLDKAIYLDLYDSAVGHPYLQERGISDTTARKLGLAYDPADPVDGEERILFPVFGVDGSLHGFSGRAINEGARLKVRDYAGLAKAECILGAHLLADINVRRIHLVEGLFDYARSWELGFPAGALMHSSATKAQLEILKSISKPTYLFLDNDDAGQKGVKDVGKGLSRYQPVMRVRYPKVWIDDPDDPQGGHWLKDPGELTQEEYAEMVRDSRLY